MTGKKIGKDNIYIHASADEELPEHLLKRVREAAKKVTKRVSESEDECCLYSLKDFNFIITHPDYIEFVEAEHFDKTYEPVLGKRWRVDKHDNVIFIPKPAKPRILHQRYKTVKDDYEGFDIGLDTAREKWYRHHFNRHDMAGAGFQHKWVEMIDKITGYIEESHRKNLTT